MSTNPNDPFDNPNAVQNSAQPTYGQENYVQGPPRKSNKGLWIGCGLASLLGILVCCGGIGFMSYMGLGAVGDIVKAEVENSPTVIENFGQIETMRLNLTATGQEAQNIEPGQGSPLVFDVQGTKANGMIIAQQSTTGGIESAVLVTADGERMPIELSGGGNENLDEIEMQLNDLIETGSPQE